MTNGMHALRNVGSGACLENTTSVICDFKQLSVANAKVEHLDKTTAILNELEANGTIKLEDNGSVSVMSTPARKYDDAVDGY